MRILSFIFIFIFFSGKGQVIRDYVVNGSFENLYDCSFPKVLRKALGWSGIDSISGTASINHTCNNRVPSSANTWQYPRKGEGFTLTTFYWPGFGRGYLRNRLKSTLLANHIYCVRFYVNIANTSPRGMDGFGAYFADGNLDTITKCTIPLTYLSPQVKNPIGNVISDTLNWVPITGTFVATGTEKYVVIGNFLADNAVTTSTINGPYVAQEWTDVCIDDVSCFDVDLPAFAGPDQPFFSGDSVFIGGNDPGLDEFCTWYQLPNMSVPIDTIAGLYVKPVQTSTYVVRQQLWCSGVRYDTVVVYKDAVGISSITSLTKKPLLHPNPCSSALSISQLPKNEQLLISFYDGSGRELFVKEVQTEKTEVTLDLDLAEGIYFIKVRMGDGSCFNFKQVIGQ